MNTVFFLLAAMTAFFGVACLALSQERHWKKVLGYSRKELSAPRRVGWGLVFLSGVFCIVRDGGGFAALIWPLLLALGAFLTACTLTWAPNRLRGVARLFDRSAPADAPPAASGNAN
ncbi:MAG: DUF3325 domain-containing protein [Pseudomonadota bacterium]